MGSLFSQILMGMINLVSSGGIKGPANWQPGYGLGEFHLNGGDSHG